MEIEESRGVDAETRFRLYLLILNRYKDLIKEKESKTISEIKEMVSPYKSEFLKSMKNKLVSDVPNYNYENNFFMAVENAIKYMKTLRTCEFTIPFWMTFEEINELKITDSANKAVLFAALLRSFGSEDVKVVVTKNRKQYVRFRWGEDRYLFVPETGSLLRNADVMRVFESDPPAYAFNDLAYENYEE